MNNISYIVWQNQFVVDKGYTQCARESNTFHRHTFPSVSKKCLPVCWFRGSKIQENIYNANDLSTKWKKGRNSRCSRSVCNFLGIQCALPNSYLKESVLELQIYSYFFPICHANCSLPVNLEKEKTRWQSLPKKLGKLLGKLPKKL